MKAKPKLVLAFIISIIFVENALSQSSTYEQIELTPLIREHWFDFEAKDTLCIKGVVFNLDSNTFISNATVELIINSHVENTIYTDKDGTFIIKCALPDTFRINIRYKDMIGFARETKTKKNGYMLKAELSRNVIK